MLNNILIHAPSRGGGGDRGSGPPLKNQKALGFRSNTGQDPLKYHKATKPAFNIRLSLARQRNAIEVFRWWANNGRLVVVFGFSLPSSLKHTQKSLSELDPLWQNFLDPRMQPNLIQKLKLKVQFALIDTAFKLFHTLFALCSWSLYEGCSNMNATGFTTFFTYMLWQNGKRFYKGLYVTFKVALDRKKNTVYLSSYSPLNKGHVCILTNSMLENIPVLETRRAYNSSKNRWNFLKFIRKYPHTLT